MYVYVCVCMHAYNYVSMYVCTYMYVRMYVCTYVRMYVCTYVRMYLYVCTYVPICMYVCTYMYVRMYLYVCTYVPICMYVCTYVPTWHHGRKNLCTPCVRHVYAMSAMSHLCTPPPTSTLRLDLLAPRTLVERCQDGGVKANKEQHRWKT